MALAIAEQLCWVQLVAVGYSRPAHGQPPKGGWPPHKLIRETIAKRDGAKATPIPTTS